MKLQLVFTISIVICVFLGCSDAGDKKEKKGKKKGAVEETIDYVTGKTPITAGQKAKAKLIETSIRNAVNPAALRNWLIQDTSADNTSKTNGEEN